MQKIEYFCDKCGEAINGSTAPKDGNTMVAGGSELVTLKYESIMGHNKFLSDKNYHYYCFLDIARLF